MSDKLRDFDIGELDNVADIEMDSPELGESLRQDESEIVVPRCEFLTGGAGTGKTTEIRRRMDVYKNDFPHRDRNYAVLAATTGIAAINLGGTTTTINSLLKFFDIDSLRDANQHGRVLAGLKECFRIGDNLCVDEVSMMHAEMLDIIWANMVELNQQEEVKERGGFGIILTGDFCQLPPVPEKDTKTGRSVPPKYAFEALCWEHFEKSTTKLTKVWRQDDPFFIQALKFAREGDGVNCAATLSKHPGVKFSEEIDDNFDGTTIFSKNQEVDRHNQTRLRQLLYQGKKKITVRSYRWGKQRSEWKSIPTELELCEGCFVMILANDSKQNGFRFANGSTGDVVCFYEKAGQQPTPDSLVSEKPTTMGQREMILLPQAPLLPAPLTWPVADDDPDLAGMDLDDDAPAQKLTEEPLAPAPAILEPIESLPEEGGTPLTFSIRLKDKTKAGMCVEIGKITRRLFQKEHPEGKKKPEYLNFKDWKAQNGVLTTGMTAKAIKFEYEARYLRVLTQENKSSHRLAEQGCTCGWKLQHIEEMNEAWMKHVREQPSEIYFDYEEGKWVTGEITYYPLRIAYATTVHKSQGLTLDRVQIDFINQFFGQPSMAYVALSRVRTAEGLRLVGSPRLLAERCNVSKKVVRFL